MVLGCVEPRGSRSSCDQVPEAYGCGGGPSRPPACGHRTPGALVRDWALATLRTILRRLIIEGATSVRTTVLEPLLQPQLCLQPMPLEPHIFVTRTLARSNYFLIFLSIITPNSQPAEKYLTVYSSLVVRQLETATSQHNAIINI